MVIHEITEVPKGNPFLHDPFNMGVTIGKNVTVMMGNHNDVECEYLYVIDTRNGKKFKVTFDKGV